MLPGTCGKILTPVEVVLLVLGLPDRPVQRPGQPVELRPRLVRATHGVRLDLEVSVIARGHPGGAVSAMALR
jgi:hypothetical protein